MVAVIYGSTTGNTFDIAQRVKQLMMGQDVELFDVKDAGLDPVVSYNQIIFAIPTWDYGEVQEDWADMWDAIEHYPLDGKQCALIGLGDQLGYGEWYVDAMGLLHEKLIAQGADLVGYWPKDESYDFIESKALTDDGRSFVGLALDEDTQRHLTDERLSQWYVLVEGEFNA